MATSLAEKLVQFPMRLVCRLPAVNDPWLLAGFDWKNGERAWKQELDSHR